MAPPLRIEVEGNLFSVEGSGLAGVAFARRLF
jgi:hypothetical protein